MPSLPVLDVTRPETARTVGTELETTVHALVLRLRATTISDAAACEQAVIDRQQLADAIKRVTDFFAPFKEMAHRLHKALCDRERDILEPARKLYADKALAISLYKQFEDDQRQQREREEQQRRQREHDARVAAEAAALEQAGHRELAAAVVDEAIQAAPPVVVLPDVTKTIPGLRFVRRYHWRYVHDDPVEAMKLIPRQWLIPDEKKIGQYARAMKGAGAIAGIEFYSVDDPIR
jgi:hypothetical protein